MVYLLYNVNISRRYLGKSKNRKEVKTMLFSAKKKVKV